MEISRVAGLSKQCQQVYQYLRTGRGITTLEAMRMDPPICRLSERCRELDTYLGYSLIRVRESHNGKTYTRYSLPKDKLKPVQQEIFQSHPKSEIWFSDREADLH